MTNLISRATAYTSSLLKRFQTKRFLAVVLVAFVLLATGAAPGPDAALGKKIDTVLQQSDTQRPQTTGEWNREARETEGAPGERAKKIAGESAEAVKDFGSLYPDTAKTSTRASENNLAR